MKVHMGWWWAEEESVVAERDLPAIYDHDEAAMIVTLLSPTATSHGRSRSSVSQCSFNVPEIHGLIGFFLLG